ncbi:MAG: PhnD/SsuA/transferrin family substrate-binding protein [Pseudomonadota bacterium]
MAGLVALDMYDWPELRTETDAFWQRLSGFLAEDGIDADSQLTRFEEVSTPWRDPDLLLGQTCGLPLISGKCGDAVVVARPCYGVEGCEDVDGGTYRSALICRSDAADDLADFRGKTAAINEWGSQSGFNAFADALGDLGLGPAGFFGNVLLSGSHRASADAVAAGKADLCALDAVAWAIYKTVAPRQTADLQVIGWTAAAPCLPFITAPKNRDLAQALCHALDRAARASPPCPALPVRVGPADPTDYQPIREMAARVKGIAFASQI